MATVVTTCSVAYAAPEANIVMTWPVGPQEVENIYFIETEWSEAVNADTELVLTLNRVTDGITEPVTTGTFVKADDATATWNIQLEELIEVPGSYSLTIPEGALYNGESYEASLSANELTTIDFVVKESEGGDIDYKYTLKSSTPADGANVTSIKVVDIYWDGPVENHSGIGAGKVTLKNGSGMILQAVELDFDWDDWSHFTATFEEVTASGEYMVVFPEGIITYDGDAASPEVVLTYTIGGGAVSADGVVLKEAVPANGSTVASLDEILTFWAVTEVSTDSEHVAIVTNDKGEEVATAAIGLDMDDWDNMNKIVLTVSPAITAEGTYKVVIPAGAVTAAEGTMENEETVLTYTIGEGGTTPGDDSNVTYDFNPTDVLPENGSVIDDNDGTGMSNLSYINIMFSGFPYVKEGYEFVFTNENGEKFYSSKPSPTGEDGETVNYLTNKIFGNIIMLGLESIPSGKYTLTVPKGVIGDEAWAKSGYTSGSSNEEFTYSWDYTAKKVVEIPEEVVKAPLELEVLTLTLPDGTVANLLENPALEGIPAGSTFNILTNKNEYAQSLRIEIKDNRTGAILWNIWTLSSKEAAIPSIGVKGDDGLFHFEKAGAEIFYEGNTYTLLVAAYENFEVPESEKIFLQDTEVEIKGLTPGIVYSDVEIEDVTPEPGTVFTSYDERSFTVVYSAPVTIVTEGTVKTGYTVAYEGVKPFESITSNEDKTEWTFTIPESQLNDCMGGGIVCNVVANDMEGHRVYPEFYDYNVDNFADGFQQYVYNSYMGCPEVTVAPASGVVKDLYTFEFTCPEAEKESIGIQGIDSEGNAINIVLLDSEGNEVAMIDRDDYVQIGSNGNVIDENTEDFDIVVTKLVMHLDKEITAAGEYTLVLPAAYFMTGTEYSAFANRQQEVTYTVDPSTGVASIAAEGAEVAVVDGKVIVAGAEGTVEVYAVSGAKVASVAAQGGNAVVALEKGVYVVVVNGKSVKVVL